MPPKKRRSRQDILRAQQRSTFVGRAEQLEAFEHNLSHLLVDEGGTTYPEAFLFNVWGQGGVGKTTLLRRFEDIAKRHRAVAALTDEAIDSVPEVMAEFARQLGAQGKPCEKFDERYKVYRQKRKELETDPEAPQGFSAFMGKTVARVGLSLGRQVPGAGAAIDLVDEKTVVDSAGEWAAYVTRKLKNKDEVQLVNEPVEVLTPLFLEDLGEIIDCQVVLLFDTFERTDEVLEQWLLDVVADRHGVLPINCIWAIAGREQLNPNRWSAYEPVPLGVEPFTTEEATHFLQRKDITNAEVVEKILDLSEQLPLMLAILAESASNDPAELAEASGTAVERFLKWVDDPIKRSLAIEAALPQSLNKDVISLLVGEDQSEVLFDWIKAMPFVRERSNGWTYHDVVRPQMLRYQRKASAEEWSQKHSRLAKYFNQQAQKLGLDDTEKYKDSDWQSHTLNQLYHRLCSHPQHELPMALSQFVQALKQEHKFAQQWAATMIQTGSDTENRTVQGWGERLFKGLIAYDKAQYNETVTAFTQLLDIKEIGARERAVIFAWRGKVHSLDANYESAVVDFNRAIELDPDDKLTFINRGTAYQFLERYEEALTDSNRAVELDPEDKWAVVVRGTTQQLMKRHEEALANFNRAIELDSKHEWAFAFRGLTYQSTKRYEEALTDFNRAIELGPNNNWTITNRGETYRLMECYEKALIDFSQAIELAPEDKWAITKRGATYQAMQRYEEALADFSRTIEIDSESRQAIICRSIIYRVINRYEEALTDVNRAIELIPKSIVLIIGRGETYRVMMRYEEALADFNHAIQLSPEDKLAIAHRGETYQSMKRYEEALTDFNHAIELDSKDTWAIAHRGETYRLMMRYGEALADFNHAIELDAEDTWAIESRGQTYRSIKHYEEALADFNHAIELDAENTWAIRQRGEIYLLLHQYEPALTDFKVAVAIDPNDWRYYLQGLAHLSLSQTEEAKSDLVQAIQLAKEAYKRDASDHQNTLNLALYYLVVRNLPTAQRLYQEVINQEGHSTYTHDAIQDLKDLLTIHPNYPNAKEMQTFLQTGLDAE